MNEKMNKALQSALEPGENVLWESGVQPFGIFEGREGRGTLLCWLGVLAVALWMGIGYATHDGKGTALYVVLVLMVAIVIGASLLSYRQTLGQRCYLTDRRVMTVRPDGSVFAMAQPDAGDARLYTLDHGGAAIALGAELLPEKDRQLRWRANHPLEHSDYTLHGMVFYRVENPEKALRLLKDGKEA